MQYITMFNNSFNTLFNTLVRDVDPLIKGILAFTFFGIALYVFAKSIKLKNKDNIPFKTGKIIICILCLGVSALYTFF